MNEETLVIKEKKYIFCANRKAFTILCKLGNAKEDETAESIERLGEIWYYLLQKHQNISLDDAEKLIDEAVEDGYALADLINFTYEFVTEAFTQASNKEKKIIPFLATRKKKD